MYSRSANAIVTSQCFSLGKLLHKPLRVVRVKFGIDRFDKFISHRPGRNENLGIFDDGKTISLSRDRWTPRWMSLISVIFDSWLDGWPE